MATIEADVLRVAKANIAAFTASSLRDRMFGYAAQENALIVKYAGSIRTIRNYDDTSINSAISAMQSVIGAKQDRLTEGANISITNNVISADDMRYDDNSIRGDIASITGDIAGINSALSGKQGALTPGANISITPQGVISAVDTVYTHPAYTPRANGLYKMTVTDEGHISDAVTVTKADIAALGIPESDTIYNDQWIRDLIPTQATSSNQLADKAFVNSSISNMAARFVTPTAAGDSQWSSLAALRAGPWYSQGAPYTPTTNDYAIFLKLIGYDINNDPLNEVWRAGFDGVQWNAEYKVNDTPFTAAQIAAINSGITSTLVTSYNTHIADTTIMHVTGAERTAWNGKFTLPSGGMSSQYINGLGALTSFPSIPAGVNQNVNLASGSPANSISGASLGVTGILPVANGGTGTDSFSEGLIAYYGGGIQSLTGVYPGGILTQGAYGAGDLSWIPLGQEGQMLTVVRTSDGLALLPRWANAPQGGGGGSGTVTSITAGTGLTGGTITATGTIALATSGVASGSYGPTANASPGSAGTFTVPQVTVDAYGRITTANNRTITMPTVSGGGGGSGLDGLSIHPTPTALNTTIGGETSAVEVTPPAGRAVQVGDLLLSSAMTTKGFLAVVKRIESLAINTSVQAVAAAENNQWHGVAYGNGVFVAVSIDGTNRVMRSTDNGVTWTAVAAAANNRWSEVAYGNGVFVAVADSGTNRVMRSTDNGATWTAVAAAANDGWDAVAYGNGVFVAVAYSGINRVMLITYGVSGGITAETIAQLVDGSGGSGGGSGNYLPLTGGTMTGTVNFSDSPWTWSPKFAHLYSPSALVLRGDIDTYLTTPTVRANRILQVGTDHYPSASERHGMFTALTNDSLFFVGPGAEDDGLKPPVPESFRFQLGGTPVAPRLYLQFKSAGAGSSWTNARWDNTNGYFY